MPNAAETVEAPYTAAERLTFLPQPARRTESAPTPRPPESRRCGRLGAAVRGSRSPAAQSATGPLGRQPLRPMCRTWWGRRPVATPGPTPLRSDKMALRSPGAPRFCPRYPNTPRCAPRPCCKRAASHAPVHVTAAIYPHGESAITSAVLPRRKRPPVNGRRNWGGGCGS